jgi:2-dehydro-3-deoxyphosphogluconate aldolase/(4S)-4-hydroxy-2-oxoglutarate aldolase
MINESMRERIRSAGVIAVLILEDASTAAPLARALLAGGIRAMELTLRTPAALEALRIIRAEVPEMLAGAGTVLSPEQAREARRAGAQFAVTPGMNRRVAEVAAALDLPFAPGVCTPSDVEAALECDCRVMKFFPAVPVGGLDYLRALAAPFAHLGARFIPLGGLSPQNAPAWLAEPSVLAIGGSWLAPRELLAARQWDAVTEIARQAAALAETRPDTTLP